MSERRSVYSGSPWEKRVAYCRATRVGNVVAVSGTVASDDNGTVVGPGDVYVQAKFALEKIRTALAELGAMPEDVIRTRSFLVDITRFEEFARAHKEMFDGIDPAASAVEVSRLIAPQFLIEIEADAVIDAPLVDLASADRASVNRASADR
jgi:enamine deaminase RidA (YjgF/YER057c/UK114 family)